MILVRAWSGSLPVVQRLNIRCNNRVGEVSVHGQITRGAAGGERSEGEANLEKSSVWAKVVLVEVGLVSRSLTLLGILTSVHEGFTLRELHTS